MRTSFSRSRHKSPFGPLGNLSHSLLQLSYPFFTSLDRQDRGWSKELPRGRELNRHFEEVLRVNQEGPMTQSDFMSWAGSCVKCGKIQRAGHGLFCSTFLLGRGISPPCRNVWCRECYREASNNWFLRLNNTRESENTTDLEIESPSAASRYRCTRDGDHLMGVPFECDLCSFRNVCGRQQAFMNRWDQYTLTCIRRVQLDLMWAREPQTVASNWPKAKADYQMVVNSLSVLPETLLPQLGCPELKDGVGMMAAIATLATSLCPGHNSTNIQ
jgi:hypothetical protein